MTLIERTKVGVIWLETAGAAFTVLAMVGCIALGVYQIGAGFYGIIHGPDYSAKSLIDAVLAGLEMFFLAPLPYLAFRSITNLYVAMTKNNSKDLREAETLVGSVKRLITGLMIAVVATELIHRIIAGSDLAAKSIAAMLGLIAVLALYYWTSSASVTAANDRR